MELLKRFVAGLGIGVALVGLAMFALSVAPQSGAESAAQPAPGPGAVLPPLPGAAPAPSGGAIPAPEFPSLPAAPPTAVYSPATSAMAPAKLPEVKPAKNEVATKPPLGRSSVRFAAPAGTRVSWQVGEVFHDRDLIAPANFNFVQGETYRLRLTGVAKYPSAKFYPTMEVCAASERSVVFLAHNAVPVTFTDSELATAAEGRLVVKAVYLAGAPGAETATVTDEVSSLRPAASGDPVSAAAQRGTLLAVIRLGNVDLENPQSPALNAPPTVQLPEYGPMATPPVPNAK